MGKLKKQPIKDWFGYVIGFECPKKEIKILVCEKPQADAINLAQMSLAAYCQTAVTCWAVFQ